MEVRGVLLFNGTAFFPKNRGFAGYNVGTIAELRDGVEWIIALHLTSDVFNNAKR